MCHLHHSQSCLRHLQKHCKTIINIRTTINKTLRRKLKIEQVEPHKNPGGGGFRCCGRVSSSCSTGGTRHVTLLTNLMFIIVLQCFCRCRRHDSIVCIMVCPFSFDHCMYNGLSFFF
jgi:hypothetical protein